MKYILLMLLFSFLGPVSEAQLLPGFKASGSNDEQQLLMQNEEVSSTDLFTVFSAGQSMKRKSIHILASEFIRN